MAAHSLAVAKASLIAPFVRAEPTSVSRDQVSYFHTILDAALERCSTSNIQKCRSWLSIYATSPSRASAAAKYFKSLSTSFPASTISSEDGTPTPLRSTSRRLNILYLVSDWLHASHFHPNEDSLGGKDLRESLQPYLASIVTLAAASNGNTSHQLSDLLQLWQEAQYFTLSDWSTLKEASLRSEGEADHDDDSEVPGSKASHANLPYILPSQHGDPVMPWYDLPAANMLPQITPNSSFPIDAELMKPAKLTAGKADSTLVAVVEDLLRDAQSMYEVNSDAPEGMHLDFDELGQKLFRSKDSREAVRGESYYGWSSEFCERMKRKYLEGLPDNQQGSARAGRAADRQRSPGSSQTSGSRSRSRSRSRQPYLGRARSPADGSRSRSRSPLQPHRFGAGRGSNRTHTPGRDDSYLPPAQSHAYQLPKTQHSFPQMPRQFIPPPPPPLLTMGVPPPPFVQQGLNPTSQMPPFTSNGFVPMPPRPSDWQGPWPPPPPPPPGFVQPRGYAPPPPPPGWHGRPG